MITFAVETVDECLDELKPLLEEHWEEIAWYKDKVPFIPNYDAYYSLEAGGLLHIVTARDDGKLIGYFISVVNYSLHYMNTKYGVNDILFVHSDYRGGSTAYRMFKFAFEELKKIGCHIVTIHMKTDFPFKRLCEAVGMKMQEHLYSIYLGE